jgi:D-glycero-D-manno-heptose 1,7-bisphosphate phosphatase
MMQRLFPPAAARPLRPAVLVDLDVLIDAQTDEPSPAAAAALRALAGAGFALAVVAWRGDLAQNGFTREAFARQAAHWSRQLHALAGVALAAFELCPHAPGPLGRPACLCRKPAPGLLTRVARMHRIDRAASWLVGATLDDVEAGQRAGCRTVLLDQGAETAWRFTPLRCPDVRAQHWDDVVEAVRAPPADAACSARRAGRAVGARPGAARATAPPA